jgi:hypothetical protein
MQACISFLEKRGQVFDTWDQVWQWAESHNWPKLEQFRRVVERQKARDQERG